MLELKKVTKTYERGDQIVHALDGVDLTIEDERQRQEHVDERDRLPGCTE